MDNEEIHIIYLTSATYLRQMFLKHCYLAANEKLCVELSITWAYLAVDKNINWQYDLVVNRNW